MGLAGEFDLSVADAAIVASPLSDNLSTLGASVLHVQGRALVTERQINLQVLRDPTGVGAAAAAAQGTMREVASHYLDAVQPRAIAFFAATDGVVNLMNALASLDGATTKGGDLSRMLSAVADALDRLTDSAKETEKATRLSADISANAAQALSRALNAAVKRLDGEDGEIAQLQGRIDQTEAEIYAAIDDIIKNSNVVGDGIKGLVTYVMGLFGGEGGDKPKPAPDKPKTPEKAAEKPRDTSAKRDTATKDGAQTDKGEDDSGEIAPFPAQSIDSITSGVEGVAEAQTRLRTRNALLSTQYQDLASLGTLLAAAQTIKAQTGAMARTNAQLHEAASRTPAITHALAGGMRALAGLAVKPANHKQVIATIAAATDSWARMSVQLRQSEATFAGIGNLFPPLVLVKG